MLDLHSHILPGLDDGARTLEEALAIARAAAADGIVAIAGTPHVRDDYPTTAAAMLAAAASLRAALESERIELTLLTGGELALDRAAALDGDELRSFGLGGSRYLLLETPYSGWPLDLPTRVFELQAAGFAPILAHPERNPAATAALLEPLVAAGLLVQVTAASLDGRLGRGVRAAGLDLVERGLAHLIASDAHAPAVRGVGMSAAAAAVGGGELARWLTVDVPQAIVAGEALPPRPAGPQRPRRRWLRR